MPAGERNLRWDGRDDAGHVAAAGIYWAAWTGPGDAVRVPIVLAEVRELWKRAKLSTVSQPSQLA